ncbi:similar to dehydrogenase/reductase member 2 (predicted) [Rattus norvegicus]|uniref:Dehydrogenase/reductase member 2 like 1 n=2 Tax=Rattus norvegicus TaxID=10116 RepID=D3ZP23_RAT|nr:uncharacterized protein LOC290217 [Rattus norvegicus]EDM14221.1 similar to dehydrogenase/reductase member 2 (predicted) [Rattus norvegicus]|eukprot:NP_001099505.1 uncharacterized protein LOC290217 [Rattus norvegicus]
MPISVRMAISVRTIPISVRIPISDWLYQCPASGQGWVAYGQQRLQTADHAGTCSTVWHVGKAEDWQGPGAKALGYLGGVDFLVCITAVNLLVGSTLGASEPVWDKDH